VKGRIEKMDASLSMEKQRELLQKKLDEDLQTEQTLELQINQEFEELKHVEISLEKELVQRHSAKQLCVKH
jgi:predicted HAD superfamily hydrolase